VEHEWMITGIIFKKMQNNCVQSFLDVIEYYYI